MNVVADPTVPIAKVAPARYASVAVGIDGMPSVGELQERVLAALRTAPAPMRPSEVWAAVEAEDETTTSFDAVARLLSLAAKGTQLPIERDKRGGTAFSMRWLTGAVNL